MLTDREQEVEKYQIIEKDEEMDEGTYTDNTNTIPYSNLISQAGDKTSIQFNVQFSKEFGLCKNMVEYKDEDDFLKSQYFVF